MIVNDLYEGHVERCSWDWLYLVGVLIVVIVCIVAAAIAYDEWAEQTYQRVKGLEL